MGPTLKSVCVPSEIYLEKTDFFSIANSYQLQRASALRMGVCVHFSSNHWDAICPWSLQTLYMLSPSYSTWVHKVIGPKVFRSCFHGVFYHLWILQSFHLLPHRIPWAPREENWWSNPFWDWVFQVLSLSAHCPTMGLYICSRLLHRKLLWWWLGEKLINTYSRRSWGIILLLCSLAGVVFDFPLGPWPILSLARGHASNVRDEDHFMN